MAGKHYYEHDERWGLDLDLVRTFRRFDRPRIVELGCGPGLVLRACAALFPDYRRILGVDYSKQLCVIARRELAGIGRTEIRHRSIEQYLNRAKPGSADLILLLNNTLGNCWAEGDILEHYESILKRLANLLDRDGVALVSVYDVGGATLGPYGRDLELVEDLGGGSFVGRVRRLAREEDFFCHLFEMQEIRGLLINAGLRVLLSETRCRRHVVLVDRGGRGA